MLLGTEIGAALTALEPLGIDLIGLNCATGPAEMSEHLRYLSRHAAVAVACMPNAGLPQLTTDGAHYPLTPDELADAHDTFTREFGLALVGGCCGTTPEHISRVVETVRGRELAKRKPRREPGASSLYQHVPFRQDTSYLSIGERTNANGSKAFREAMLAEKWDDCIEIARSQIRDGAHLLDLNVDYVGRDGVADMRTMAVRLATSSTLPIMLDSTEPEVIEAGLETLGRPLRHQLGQLRGRRRAGLTVRARDADHQGARGGRRRAHHRRGGPGPDRGLEGPGRLAADRRPDRRVGACATSDIIVDCLTFPIAHRAGGDPPGRPRDDRGDPRGQAALPRGADHARRLQRLVRLSPAARVVLNSVFLHECVKAGLDSAIVHAAKILPLSRIPDDQRKVALDLVYDRRRTGYDPLQTMLELFAGVDAPATPRRPGRRAGRAPAGRAARAPDHRRRAERPRGRPRRGARDGQLGPRHHQRRPAGRHEDRRRAVRLR